MAYWYVLLHPKQLQLGSFQNDSAGSGRDLVVQRVRVVTAQTTQPPIHPAQSSCRTVGRLRSDPMLGLWACCAAGGNSSTCSQALIGYQPQSTPRRNFPWGSFKWSACRFDSPYSLVRLLHRRTENTSATCKKRPHPLRSRIWQSFLEDKRGRVLTLTYWKADGVVTRDLNRTIPNCGTAF